MKFAYSLNGIDTHDLLTTGQAITPQGFKGLELRFDRDCLNPYFMTDSDIRRIGENLCRTNINPVAISVESSSLRFDVSYVPSLISSNEVDRNNGISVAKEGIRFAQLLNIPIVSLHSGCLTGEYENLASEEVEIRLIESIEEIIYAIDENDNITLVIKPEIGMFIETLEDAKRIIEKVDNKKLRLHLDIYHLYATELNYLESLRMYIPYASYISFSDVMNEDINFHVVSKIIANHYHYYITLELCEHEHERKKALSESCRFLTNIFNQTNLEEAKYLGEIDHRVVDAPYVRLATANYGINGDVGCMYDIRFRQPNSEQYLSPILLHSMEHALLYYFKKKYADAFLCLAPMGCQTGFYLVLLNESSTQEIQSDLIEALHNISEFELVPFANDEQCGQAKYHDLSMVKEFALETINAMENINKVIK